MAETTDKEDLPDISTRNAWNTYGMDGTEEEIGASGTQ